MNLTQKDIVRFWSKVVKGKNNKCWPWLGGRQKSGHGIFTAHGKYLLAHRVSYWLTHKKLPIKSLMVIHDCENASCVNPKHLLEGDCIKNGNYPECRRKISVALNNGAAPWLGITGNKHPRFGIKHNTETKRKIREKTLLRQRNKNGQLI